MPALNYHPCFAARVQSGEKLQTIRATRKVPIKPGEILYHYTGMRTKACRCLGISKCSSVLGIDIISVCSRAVCLQVGPGGGQRRLCNAEIEALALADGFATVENFWAWFTTGTGCFTGHLIQWHEISPF
jgi:hypothetical protein